MEHIFLITQNLYHIFETYSILKNVKFNFQKIHEILKFTSLKKITLPQINSFYYDIS